MTDRAHGPLGRRRRPDKLAPESMMLPALVRRAWIAVLVLCPALDGGWIQAQEDPGPLTAEAIPAPGATLREFSFLEVRFSEPVTGVDPADLLINGMPATSMSEPAEALFLFGFDQPADGPVQVTWRADHGIVARGNATQVFAGGGWGYTLDAAAPPGWLMISEFLADNRRTLNDEDGEASDWIEVFNPDDAPVDVTGWFLTDDPADLRKWAFPAVGVPGNGYLLVFASGKNRVEPTARLHTNFRLTDAGEYLALVTPGGVVVSDFAPAFPRQTTDVSYGRVETDPGAAGFFVQPTPGKPNSTAGAGFAAPVLFSRPAGTFTTPFELRLAATGTAPVIRYTLDNSTPTNTSPVYTGPLRITNSAIVRARAYANDLLPGPVGGATYVLLSGAVTNFTSDLPVIVLHSLGRGAPSSARMNFSSLLVFEPVRGVTSLTNAPVLASRGGLQVRGSSTEGYAKSSYKLELWDEANLDRRASLLGMPEESDWVLYAPNNFDVPLIHNPFIHQLSRDTGMYSSRTRFVEVFQNKASGGIATNHYAGIYVLEEKIKIGPDRVAIDELEPENLTPPSVTGGYLLKIDRLDPGDSGLTGAGATVGYLDPKEREIKLPQRKPQLDYIRNHLIQFNRALGTNATWRDPVLGYPAYIDVDAWIDFHVLEVLSGNVDALVLSTYFHKPRGGRLRFGPHWDFDRALGSTDGRDANPRTWNTGPFFSAAWWSRLFQDKDFWQRWVDRWQEHRADAFSRTNLNRVIDSLAGEIRQAYPRELAKWRVRPRQADGRTGGTFDTEMQWMKNWLSNRMDFIDRQLAQPPVSDVAPGPVTPGTVVRFSAAPGATIYYTTDGSDPRAPQGAVAPSATPYTGPLMILQNVGITARTLDPTKRQTGGPPTTSSTSWSGPLRAAYLVDPPRVLLTEIHFHPEPGAGEALEFLELLNAGPRAVNLAGFRLTNGVDFEFTAAAGPTVLAPGERLVLARDLDAFRAAHPQVTNVTGNFGGALGNDGNRLRLVSNLGQTLFDLVYHDDWQPLADGAGFSLVLQSEETAPDDLGQAGRWRTSTHTGGSPGTADPPPPTVPRVVVNEVVSNPLPKARDFIELYNPTETTADVSGWWISDDFGEPRKYRLPAGSQIEAGGHLVIDGLALAEGGFGFSATGDEVFLFSAEAGGALTGWHHGFAFGAQEAGTSFGRHVNSVGRELFVAGSPTPGTRNLVPGPAPGAVVEIQFQPPALDGWDNTRDEYLELDDSVLGDEPVAAFDPAHPDHTWRVRGAVDFEFPAGFRFPANRRVVLVGFDPDRDPFALAAFRARYRLGADTVILGPWRGSLPNEGGTIRLLKPLPPVAAPVPGGFDVPYAVIEEITYGATAPWPDGARGTGQSLTRSFPQAFGDDPALWRAGPATPGDVDTDGDGLPNGWEEANGLNSLSDWANDGPAGDRDGDGRTNWEEYLAGTAANDASDFLRLTATPDSPGRVALRIHAGAGRGIWLQQRDTAAAGAWQDRWQFHLPADSADLLVLEPATHTARFYRLEAR